MQIDDDAALVVIGSLVELNTRYYSLRHDTTLFHKHTQIAPMSREKVWYKQRSVVLITGDARHQAVAQTAAILQAISPEV